MNSIHHRNGDAMLLPVSVSRGYDLPALHQQALEARRASPAQGLRGIFARIAASFERRRAIAELRALTDRELADIGLHRSDIPYVFTRQAVPVAERAPVRASAPRAANDTAMNGRLAA